MMRSFNAGGFDFQPFSPKQQKLLAWWREGSPHAKQTVIIADGAIRSGKTIAMICSFLEWSLNTFENQDFIIAGRSMGALKRNVVKHMLSILRAWGMAYDYNRSNNYIIVGTNTYHLFGASNEASQDVIQGMTAAGAYADEVALFPRSFVEQMMGRCSVDGSKIFVNCNPEGPYHWMKLEIVDRAKEKNFYYLHFTMEDNLTLSNEKRKEYATQYSGVFYLRYILGLWAMAEGVIYNMFSEENLVDEVPIITEKDIYTNTERDNVRRRFVGVDYGQNNPTAYVMVCELNDGSLYVEKEHRATSLTNEGKVKELIDFIGDAEVRTVIVDPSALAFIDQIKVDTTLKVAGANNDVLNGISSVSTLFENRRLKVVRSAENMRKELLSYVWDDKAQERGDDRPIKANDHFLDALRYVIYTVYGKVGKVRIHDKYAGGL